MKCEWIFAVCENSQTHIHPAGIITANLDDFTGDGSLFLQGPSLSCLSSTASRDGRFVMTLELGQHILI